MSQKRIKELARRMFVGKPEVWVDGWSINGHGKWTAELATDGKPIPNMRSEGSTKREAVEVLLEAVEAFAGHAERDG